jgi:hypothetical protein
MLYTISLKDNKLEKTDEIFFFDMPDKEELAAVGIAAFTYDDDTNEYKYYTATGNEFNPELTARLESVRDAVLTTYHTLFDKDALARLKSRKLYNLRADSIAASYANPNCTFVTSLGVLIYGDKKNIDYYTNLLNYYALDTTEIVGVKGEHIVVTRDELETIVRESYINMEYLRRQEDKAITELAALTTEEEVNNYIPKVVPYNFAIEDKSAQGDITDIEAFVDARLSEFTTIEDALVELSDNYEESTELTQDAVVELADEVYALKEEIKQLKAKLGE